MSPASQFHGSIAFRFGHFIGEHVYEHGLGEMYAAETGFLLEHNPDTVRAPDVAFLCNERVIDTPRGYFPGPPDLAVEVVSPDETEDAVLDKVAFWLEKGARLVWVAWPRTRTVSEHRPGVSQRLFHDGDQIEGGDVLPGFRCGVTDIFGNVG